MTTFALHWRRDTDRPDRVAGDGLALGLTRLRNDPVTRWARGPLTVWHFAEDPWFSVFENPAGLVAILAGRLDAFSELIESVGGQRTVGTDPSDARVLAAAYEKWGRDCLPHLIGDFVAVIWEPRSRTLLAARDRVGVVPLYFWEKGQEVVFAGHVGGVMAHPAVPVVPNEGYIAEVLSDDIRSRTETLYRDVRRLPAGHVRVFGPTGRTWEWAPQYSLEVMPWGAAEADERYLDILHRAIRDRMRRTDKVGTELSGGLDSSTVAALTASHAFAQYGEPLRSYSLTFPGLPCDESTFIAEVAGNSGIQANLIPCAPLDPHRWASEIDATHDLPFTPNGVAWIGLKSAAQNDGLSALLTGQGGDQGFDIDQSYPLELTLNCRFRAALSAAGRLSPNGGLTTRIARGIVRPLLLQGIRTISPGFRRHRIPDWINPAFAQTTQLEGRLAPRDPPPRTSREARLGWYRSGWQAYVLESMSLFDSLSGVKSLHPFYDSRIIQFALEIDEAQRWCDGQFRTIQRRSMAGLLPETIVRRTTKADFSHLFVEEFTRGGGRELFAQLRIASERDWVVADALVRRWNTMEESVRAGGGPSGIWVLWAAVAVERWSQTLPRV